ncbi:MAG TPA: EscF/YscF/HrpA family type III secretion system needle major subunit [Terriglobia bacterium]|jgi:hypothetical protein|nr:EscF/YscF/HrpA family type III secretion system needle major subunit [Terriglobia bacterium]
MNTGISAPLGGASGGGSLSSGIDNLTNSVDSMSSNMTNYAQTMDPTNPADNLQLQQYEYQYESTINMESSYIYDLKNMCSTIASNMK